MAGSWPSSDSIRSSHLLTLLSSLALFSGSFSPYGGISGLTIHAALASPGGGRLLLPCGPAEGPPLALVAACAGNVPYGQECMLLSWARLECHVLPGSQGSQSAPHILSGQRMRQENHSVVSRRGKDNTRE